MENSDSGVICPQARDAMDIVNGSDRYNTQIYREEGKEREILVFHNDDFSTSKRNRKFDIPVDNALARIFCQAGHEDSPIGAIYRRGNDMHNKKVDELGDYLKQHDIEFNPALVKSV